MSYYGQYDTDGEWDAAAASHKTGWMARTLANIAIAEARGMEPEPVPEPLYSYEGQITYDPLFASQGYVIYSPVVPTALWSGWSAHNPVLSEPIDTSWRRRPYLYVTAGPGGASVSIGPRGGTQHVFAVNPSTTRKIGPFIAKAFSGAVTFMCTGNPLVEVALELVPLGHGWTERGAAPAAA